MFLLSGDQSMDISYIPVVLFIGLIYFFFIITLCLLKACRIQSSSKRRQIDLALNNPYGLYPPKVETSRLRKFLTLAYLIFRVFYTFLFTASVVLSLILSLQYQPSQNINQLVSFSNRQPPYFQDDSRVNILMSGSYDDFSKQNSIHKQETLRDVEKCSKESEKRRNIFDNVMMSFVTSILRYISKSESFIRTSDTTSKFSKSFEDELKEIRSDFRHSIKSGDSIQSFSWNILNDPSGQFNNGWMNNFNSLMRRLLADFRDSTREVMNVVSEVLPKNPWFGPVLQAHAEYRSNSNIVIDKVAELANRIYPKLNTDHNTTDKFSLAEFFGYPEIMNAIFTFSHAEGKLKKNYGQLTPKMIMDRSIDDSIRSQNFQEYIKFFRDLTLFQPDRNLAQNIQKISMDDTNFLTEDLLLTSFLITDRENVVRNRERSYFSNDSPFEISIAHLRLMFLFLDAYLIMSRCVTTYRIIKRLWFGHYRNIKVKRSSFISSKYQDKNSDASDKDAKPSPSNYSNVESIKSTNIGFSGYCNNGDIHYLDFIAFLGIAIITLALCLFFQSNPNMDNFNGKNVNVTLLVEKDLPTVEYPDAMAQYSEVNIMKSLEKINLKFSLGMDKLRNRISYDQHSIIFQQLSEWCSTRTTWFGILRNEPGLSLHNENRTAEQFGGSQNNENYSDFCVYKGNFDAFLTATKERKLLQKMIIAGNYQTSPVHPFDMNNTDDYIVEAFSLSQCQLDKSSVEKSFNKNPNDNGNGRATLDDLNRGLERKKLQNISNEFLHISMMALIVILGVICLFEVIQIIARILSLRLRRTYPVNITLINSKPNQKLLYNQISSYYNRRNNEKIRSEIAENQNKLQAYSSLATDEDIFLSGTLQPFSNDLNSQLAGLNILEPQLIPISQNGNYTLSTSGFYLNPNSPYNVHTSNLVPLSASYTIQQDDQVNTSTLRSLYSGGNNNLKFESIENLFSDSSQSAQPVYILPSTSKLHSDVDESKISSAAFYVTKSP